MLYHSDNVQAAGFVEHLKLPHYVDFQGELEAHPPAARGAACRGRGPEAADEPRGLQLRLPGRADQADDPPRHPEGGGDPGLPGAVRLARHAAALWLGHRRHPGHRRLPRPERRAEGDRPGGRRHHQRRLDPAFFARTAGVRTTDAHRRRRRSSRRGTACPRRRCARARSSSTRCRSRSRCACSSRARRETRRLHALADYGIMQVRLYEDIARLGRVATSYNYPVLVNGRYVMAPSPIPKFDNPKLHRNAGAAAVRRRPREAHLRGAALDRGREPGLRGPPVRDPALGPSPAPCAAPPTATSTRWSPTTGAGGMFVCSDTDHCAGARRGPPRPHGRDAPEALRGMSETAARGRGPRPSALAARGARSTVSPSTCGRARCWRSSASSGSGKTHAAELHLGLHRAGRWHGALRAPGTTGVVDVLQHARAGAPRWLARTEWGFVHQNPRDGLRLARHRRRQHRRAADGGGRAPLRPHPRHGAATGWSGSRSTPTASTMGRAPSPAACSSACRSRATSYRGRGWCSWTSPPAGSTSRSRRACST